VLKNVAIPPPRITPKIVTGSTDSLDRNVARFIGFKLKLEKEIDSGTRSNKVAEKTVKGRKKSMAFAAPNLRIFKNGVPKCRAKALAWR
jgi:hypothetical protein